MKHMVFLAYTAVFLLFTVPVYSVELDMHTTCACQAILKNPGDRARANKMAGKYLAGARALVIRHRELTRNGELTERDNREELARVKDDVHALQLKAADVIVQCMSPDMRILEEAFEKSDVSKHFKWRVNSKKLPIKIICNGEEAGAIAELNWAEGFLLELSMEIPSLLTPRGLVNCGDEDLLEGTIAHEMHHLIKFDSLRKRLCKKGKIETIETCRNCETNADTFAYLYSKTACTGLAKSWVLDSEECRSVLMMRFHMTHPKPKVRKVCAEQYGKSIWGLDSPSTLLENSPAERDFGIISMNKKKYLRENIRELGKVAVGAATGIVIGGILRMMKTART